MFKLFKNIKFTDAAKLKNFSQFKVVRNFTVIKCDDLNKAADQKTEDEKIRCTLASTYRLVGNKGWDQSIYNHITIRSKENPEHFLINPFGQFYSEITASGLVKIDSDCNVIEPGSTTFGVNYAGFTLHSAIHDSREDINAVIHVHTSAAAGISALKCGLLPISQEAIICTAAGVGYHDYEGILIDEEMRGVIANDLAANRILMLRNHGAAFCGKTVEEAFFWLYTFMQAVKIQHVAMSAANGTENLIYPPSRIVDHMRMALEAGAVNANSTDGIEWGLGDMDFEAEMRNMDQQGFQTGYPYKKSSQ